jgi:chromosome segregation ATPase
VLDRHEAAARLRDRLGKWYAAKWKLISMDLESAEAECAVASGERETATLAVRALEEAAELRLEDERSFQQKLDVARAAMHSTEREADASRFQLQQVTDRLRLVEQSTSDMSVRLARVRGERTRTASRLVECERAYAGATADRARLEIEVGGAEEVASRLGAAVDHLQSERAQLSERRGETEKEHTRLTEELRIGRLTLRDQDRRDRDSEERLAARSSELEAINLDLSSTLASLDACVKTIEANTAHLASAEVASHDAGRRLERLERVRARARAIESRLTRERDAVEESLHALEDFASGSVLPSIDVPEGWERAAAAAMAGRGTGESDQMRERWGASEAAAFMNWRSNIEQSVDGAFQWADGMIAGFGDPPNPFVSTIFVENDTDGLELWWRLAPLPAHTVGSPTIQVVTRHGAVISALGIERQRRDDRATRYLVCRAALAKLQGRAGRLGVRTGLVERALGQHQTFVAEARAAARRTNENLQATLREKAVFESTMEEIVRRKWRAEAEVNALTGTLAENRERVRVLRLRIGQLEAPLEAVSRQLSEMTRHEEARGRALHDLREELAAAMGVRDNTNRQLAGSTVVESRESQAYAGLLREIDRLRFEERHALEELRALENEKSRLTEGIEGARDSVARLMDILGEQTERIATIELERPGTPVGGARGARTCDGAARAAQRGAE